MKQRKSEDAFEEKKYCTRYCMVNRMQ